MAKIFALIKALFLLIGLIIMIIMNLLFICDDKAQYFDIYGSFFWVFFCLFLLIFIFMISHGVFLGRLKYYDSDNIINEMIRKQNENTKKSTDYTSINLGIDSGFFGFHLLVLIISLIAAKSGDNKTNAVKKIIKIL